MTVGRFAAGLAVAGACLVSVGAGWIYRPAGVIVAGLFLLAAGVEALRPPRGGA